MSKLLGLSCAVLLALVSVGSFVYLTLKINAVEQQIAAGEGQLAAGRAELASGKARLAEGKNEFRRAKRDAVKDFLRGGGGRQEQSDEEALRGLIQGHRDYRDAKEQITEGGQQVAQGERRLAAGTQQLREGQEQLRFAKRARWVAGGAALLFAAMAIALGLRWRMRDRA